MSVNRLKVLIPGVTLALATLLAVLPWGLSSDTRFLLPLLPFAVIHLWAVRQPALMPEWLVFLSGLATDVLTHGPLGFWSLVFLLGLVLAHVIRTNGAWGNGGRWLHFCATLVVLALAQWVIAAAYFMSAIDWRPFLAAAFVAALIYPLLGVLLGPLERLWPTSDNARFERGG